MSVNVNMNMGQNLVLIGAVVFVAIALTATAIQITRHDQAPVPSPSQALAPPSDPLQAELIRCQSLGEAGPRDDACLEAWARSRRRFLGTESSKATASSSLLPSPPRENAR